MIRQSADTETKETFDGVKKLTVPAASYVLTDKKLTGVVEDTIKALDPTKAFTPEKTLAEWSSLSQDQLLKEVLLMTDQEEGQALVDYWARTLERARMLDGYGSTAANLDSMATFETKLRDDFEALDWSSVDEEGFFSTPLYYIMNWMPESTEPEYLQTESRIKQREVLNTTLKQLSDSGNVRMYNFAQGLFLDTKIKEGLKLESYPITSLEQCP